MYRGRITIAGLLVAILFFAAVLFRVVERLPVTVQWTIAAVGLLVSYLFGSWLASTPLGVAMALPCLVFLLAGRALRQVEPRITRPGLVGGGLLVVSAVAIAVLPLQFVDLKHGSFGTPIVGVLVAVAVASGFLLVAQRVRYAPSVARGIVALAAVGIAVVLSHPIVILAVKALGFPNKVVFLAAVVIPWSIALVLPYTPLSPILIGAPQRRSNSRSGVPALDATSS